MPATPVWLASLEALLNRQIAAQAEATTAAKRLSGKTLQIDVDGFVRVRAATLGSRLVLMPGDDSPCDAVISGSLQALLKMAAGGGLARDRLVREPAPAGVQVRGDAEVAAAYRHLLTLAQPDWEEELSRFLGDLPARRAVRLATQAAVFLRGAVRSLGENVAEYLQEESRDVVGRTELDEFLQGVDQLRESGDRLEARVKRLELRLSRSDRSPGAG